MDQKSKDHITHSIILYLQNEADPEERQLIDDWIQESTSNKKYFEEYKTIWESSKNKSVFEEIDINKEWDTFKKETGIKDAKKGFSKNQWFKIAASLVILLGTGFYANLIFNSEVHIIAELGKENKFILPDNSMVWLNEGSELLYKKDFKGKVRQVELIGEGFFEVRKNINKPFIVKAQHTETKVLGTSFNIKSLKEQQQIEVVLVTGKVEFSSRNQKIILLPGDKVITLSNGEIVKNKNQDVNFDSWKTGVLNFEKDLLSQVFYDIGKFYDKEIQIENAQLLDCTLTNNFNNESFEEVLETLKIVFDITIESINSNSVIIKGGSCR
ncbi:FecR family protein [uncultured Aquimarina sp.]|uniref:FecR family protein n=1 Tax=uncultured Aquimarina sp. TaxID=575652 RepID=UPI00262CBAF0|nr:FecR family protein [uncultured Aquimarina sp.]